MFSLMSKSFFLFLFILPDFILCDETEWPGFIEDAEGNRYPLGHILEVERLPEKKFPEMKLRQSLPESFDARKKWPECKDIIGLIRNQKQCGSCWAFSIAEIISDRICIQSKGLKKVVISPEDLMTCCSYIGCDGCESGSPEMALKFWKEKGIVTGGDYNSHEGCRPYTIPDDWNKYRDSTPPCNKKCEKGYLIPYETDKHYGAEAHSIGPNAREIQQEIYDNGPVAAVFEVYGNFGTDKYGVYSHPDTKTANYTHAIKIIGWGLEGKTPYWLCANSYGAGWGDNGYFKILRGDPNNDCSIEKRVNTGTPQL